MSNFKSEPSEVSSVEFAQYALRERVAPLTLGSGKVRQAFAFRRLEKHERETSERKRKRSWTPNRVRDFWNADERVVPNADELRDIEEITGLRYGREEIRTAEQLIARADALLESQDSDFYGAFVAALRHAFRAVARPGVEK